MARYLFFSHDGFGVGHVRRNMLDRPGHAAPPIPTPRSSIVTGLTGAPVVARRRAAAGRAGARAGQGRRRAPTATTTMSFDEAVERRSARFDAVVADHRPDVVVVDRHPYGIAGELRAGLDRARGRRRRHRARPARHPRRARRRRRRAGRRRLARRRRRATTRVLVYGERMLCDHEAEYGLPVAPDVLRLGRRAAGRRPPGARAARRHRRRLRRRRGGVRARPRRLRVDAGAARRARRRPVRHVVARRATRSPRRGLDDRVRLVRDTPGCGPLFARADRVVQMAGYNSTFECLAAGIRPVLVPRRTPAPRAGHPGHPAGRARPRRRRRRAGVGGRGRLAAAPPAPLAPGELAGAGIRLDGADRARPRQLGRARRPARRSPPDARRDAPLLAVRLAVPAGPRAGHPAVARSVGDRPGPAVAAALDRRRRARRRRSRRRPTNATTLLAVAVGALVALVLAGAVVDYFASRLLSAAGLHIANALRVAVLDRLQRLSLRYHAPARVGDLVARVTSDVSYTQDMFVQVLATLLPERPAGDRHVRRDGRCSTRRSRCSPCSPRRRSCWPPTAPACGCAGVARRAQGRRRPGLGGDREPVVDPADPGVHARGRPRPPLPAAVRGQPRRRPGRGAARVPVRTAGRRVRRGVDGDRRCGSAPNGCSTATSASACCWCSLSYIGSLYKPIKSLSKLAQTISKGAAASERIGEVLDAPIDIVDRPGARADPHPRRHRAARRLVLLRARAGARRTSRCASRPARPSPSSVRPAPARPRSPRSSRACSTSTAAPCSSTASTSATTSCASLRGQIAMVAQDTVLLEGTLRENLVCGRPGVSDRDVARAARLALVDEFAARLPGRARHPPRRARRRPLRRSAPARLDRPGDPARRADRHPRRADLGARRGVRGAAPRRARQPARTAAPAS